MGRVKEHLGGNEKTRKVFSAGYVLQTIKEIKLKLSDPSSVVLNAYTLTECILVVNFFYFPPSFFFVETWPIKNVRIQWRTM